MRVLAERSVQEFVFEHDLEAQVQTVLPLVHTV